MSPLLTYISLEASLMTVVVISSDLSCADVRDLPCADGRDLPCADGRDLPCTDGRGLPCADGRDLPCADGRAQFTKIPRWKISLFVYKMFHSENVHRLVSVSEICKSLFRELTIENNQL